MKLTGASVADWGKGREPTREVAMMNITWLRQTLTKALITGTFVGNKSVRNFIHWIMVGQEYAFITDMFHDNIYLQAW